MARGSRGGGSRSHSGGSRSRSRSGGGRSHSRSSCSYSSSSYSGSSYSSHRHYHSSSILGHRHYNSSISVKVFLAIWCLVFLYIMLSVVMESYKSSASITNSIERTKLHSGNSFMTGCIVDNSNLFSNDVYMETALKEFWEETGVQPVIVTNEYDSSVNSDDDAFDWGCAFYDRFLYREDVFLTVFFNGYGDNPDEGYVAVVGGYQSDSVMDSAAIETWWNYFDRYWYSDCDWDDLFVKTYIETGNTIMTVSINGWDVLIWIIVAVIIIAVIVGVIVVVNVKRSAAKEKAEADAAILNADISKSKLPDEINDLADKYL